MVANSDLHKKSSILAHRYLMTRLSLQVVYLWRHVSSTAPPFILWWSNLEILFGPLHRSSPFIGELRCQAIQMEHGPYIAERTQNAVYIVRCLCFSPTVHTRHLLSSIVFYGTGIYYSDVLQLNETAGSVSAASMRPLKSYDILVIFTKTIIDSHSLKRDIIAKTN
jgi:hypothetical protein